MKRLLVVAAIVVIAVPALAGSEILPINGTDGYLKFDVATGTVTPITGQTRDVGPPVWEAGSEYVNYFWGAECFTGEASIEWADVAIGQGIGGFGFSEFTNSQAAAGDLYAIFLFYEEENGHNSVGRVYTAGYLIANIPGSTHPNTEYWGYIWAVELADVFVLDGSDLDGDGLGDWGYFSFFSGQTPDSGTYHTKHGPGIAGLLMGDPNTGLHPLPPLATGAEDAFDYFVDPDYNVDGGASIDPNNLTGFVGTYWFGGPPVFSQWHFSLYARVCPNRGDSGRYCCADIDGSFDCIVNLADLAQLLGHYGMTTGATLMDGDVSPGCGGWWPDRDVDLGDLAELLTEYGDDCNWP